MLYKQHSVDLSRCEECGRRTFSPHAAKTSASLVNEVAVEEEEVITFDGVDDLETTVGAY